MNSKELVKALEQKLTNNNLDPKEVKYLYKYYLGLTDTDYINDIELRPVQIFKLSYAVKRLIKGANVFHVVKSTNCLGYTFKVNKHTLIPRRETEELIDKTIKLIKQNNLKPNNIIDLGTGSGVIAISLAKAFKKTDITGIDISNKALKVAKQNNELNNTNVKFIKNKIENQDLTNYDIIISNPPYLTSSDTIDEIVYNTEPKIALFAKNKGLYYYELILNNAKNTKLIAFEIGENQGTYLTKLAKQKFPKAKVELVKDFSDKDRYLFIINE